MGVPRGEKARDYSRSTARRQRAGAEVFEARRGAFGHAAAAPFAARSRMSRTTALLCAGLLVLLASATAFGRAGGGQSYSGGSRSSYSGSSYSGTRSSYSSYKSSYSAPSSSSY